MSIERTPTNDQIAAVLLRTGNPTDEQKEQLAEYLGRAPTTEKAAPIPAEVLALATTIANEMRQANTFYGAEQRIARAIMQDRADRASQEERIREDERDRLLMACQASNTFLWLEQQGAMMPHRRARLRGGAS